jgi:hypothetical protein
MYKYQRKGEGKMEVMTKVSFIVVLFIMVVSCATTPPALPEKYNLGNYLEEVNQISAYKDMDCLNRDINCENVDNQSIMLTVNWDDYYLLVLRRPIDAHYSLVSINIDNTASKDRTYSTQTMLSEERDSSKHGHSRTDFHQAPSNIASIAAGYDKIVVQEFGDTEYYVIEKMYKLKGREQAEEIKGWLRKSSEAELQILRNHRFDMNSQ